MGWLKVGPGADIFSAPGAVCGRIRNQLASAAPRAAAATVNSAAGARQRRGSGSSIVSLYASGTSGAGVGAWIVVGASTPIPGSVSSPMTPIVKL